MNLTERLFTFKVSLIIGVRMLGLFSTSQFLGTFFGGAIGGLIYNIYDLNSVFLLTIFVAIIWWFLMITLPHTVKILEEWLWQA